MDLGFRTLLDVSKVGVVSTRNEGEEFGRDSLESQAHVGASLLHDGLDLSAGHFGGNGVTFDQNIDCVGVIIILASSRVLGTGDLDACASPLLDVLNNRSLATDDVRASRRGNRNKNGLLDVLVSPHSERGGNVNQASYLRSNLLRHLFKGLSHSINRALTLKNYRTSRSAAHVNVGLGPLGNITQNITEGLLQLTAREHLGRNQTQLFHMLSGETHDSWDVEAWSWTNTR